MPLNPHTKGGSDVPITDGGTGASDSGTALSNIGGLSTSSHSTTNHASIPGVGDLTTAAHLLVNHTGIPGVGGGTTHAQVLDASSDFVAINAALATAGTYIVYLKPGNYLYPWAQINVPAGKQLIGLTGPCGDDPAEVPSVNPVLKPTSSSTQPFIRVGGDGVVKNIWISGAVSGPGSTSAYAVQQVGLAEPIWLENIYVKDWNNGFSVPTFSVGRGRFIHCTTKGAGGHGWQIGSPAGESTTIFEGCQAIDPTQHGFYVTGSWLAFFNCKAEGAGLDGFHVATAGGVYIRFSNCHADGNANNGFNWPGTAGLGCSVDHCSASNTTNAWGFSLTTAIGSLRAQCHNCMGYNNSSGNFNVTGGWSLASQSNAT